MKKDKEWLKNKLEVLKELDMANWNQCGPNSENQNYFYGSLDAIEKALDFLSEMDEPEKVVVPKFVGEWIEESKKQGKKLCYQFGYVNDSVPFSKRKDYLFEHSETFARAWLDGYEVEEEQKYNVQLKVRALVGTVGFFLYKQGDEVLAGDNFRAYHPEKDEFRLTEQEIKEYDESCWTIAVPVEEVPND